MTTKTSLIIRKANEADAAVVAELLTTFNTEVGVMGWPWGEDTNPEYAQVSEPQARRRLKSVKKIESVFLAQVGNTAVGIAALRVVPHLDQDVPYAELTQLYVVPAHRRRGVAAALMAHVEDAARARGCTAVYLLTGGDNAGAQAFYQAAGYAPHYVGFEKFLGDRS